MSAEYSLEILTPERQFFQGQVQALTIPAPDGELTVLAGHAPLIVPLVVGVLRIKQEDSWKEAFTSEGFMEVRADGVLVFSQACEWPQEIDARRAQAAERRAAERLRQKRSINEHKQSKIAMARARARLRVSQTQSKYH